VSLLAVRLDCVCERQGTPRPFIPEPLRVDWTPALAPQHTAMVTPGLRVLPLPRARHELASQNTQPGFCIGRDEGTLSFLGRRGMQPCYSAMVAQVIMEPQYVCGAATLGCTRRRKSRQDTRPTDDCAGMHTAEKTKQTALRGSLSLDKRRPHKCSAWDEIGQGLTIFLLRCLNFFWTCPNGQRNFIPFLCIKLLHQLCPD
jgi:hypothetical protein